MVFSIKRRLLTLDFTASHHAQKTAISHHFQSVSPLKITSLFPPVAHASSSWQQSLIQALERLLLSSTGSGTKVPAKLRSNRRGDRAQGHALLISGGWWLALAFAIVLMLWHPDLLLATLAGSGTMLGVYLATTSGKTIDWVAVSRLGDRLRQPVLLAIGAGAIVSLLVYVSLAVWEATDNHWVASGLIAQGAATLAVLVLLVWQTLTRLTGRDRVELMPILLQVADENGLKRMIAIRQIGQWLEQRRLDHAECKSVAACLQYLLGRETDSAIRDAALDVLQQIQLMQVIRHPQTRDRSGSPQALEMANGEPINFSHSYQNLDKSQRDAHVSR